MFIRHRGKANGKAHFIVHGRRLAIPDSPTVAYIKNQASITKREAELSWWGF